MKFCIKMMFLALLSFRFVASSEDPALHLDVDDSKICRTCLSKPNFITRGDSENVAILLVISRQQNKVVVYEDPIGGLHVPYVFLGERGGIQEELMTTVLSNRLPFKTSTLELVQEDAPFSFYAASLEPVGSGFFDCFTTPKSRETSVLKKHGFTLSSVNGLPHGILSGYSTGNVQKLLKARGLTDCVTY